MQTTSGIQRSSSLNLFIALAILLGSNAYSHAQGSVIISSHGMKAPAVIDAENFDILAGEPDETATHSNSKATINLRFADTEIGFISTSADGRKARKTAKQAAIKILETIHSTVTTTIDVDFAKSASLSGALAMTELPFTATNGAFQGGWCYSHLKTGTDPATGAPDFRVTVDFPNNAWHVDHTSAAPTGKHDLYSALLHEFCHGLGVMSTAVDTGSSVYSIVNFTAGLSPYEPGTFSLLDDKLEHVSFGNLWDNSPMKPGDYIGYPGLLVGPNIRFSYGGSTIVIYSDAPFTVGKSLCHTPKSAVAPYDVLQELLSAGENTRAFTASDKTILRGVGYAVP